VVRVGAEPVPAARKRGPRLALWLGLGGVLAAGACAVALLGGGALVVNMTSATETAAAHSAASETAAAESARQAEATAAAGTALAEEATALAQLVEDATATAQAVPAVASAEDWAALLLDGFEDNDNGWHPFQDFEDDFGVRSFLLTRGRYAWDVTPKRDINLHDTPTMNSIADFYASVDARQISGPQSADYGLAFRVVSDNTFYTFTISDTGQFAVQLLFRGEWSTLLNWTPTGAVRPGEVNNLRVLAHGDQFTFFINDEEVASLSDDRVPQGRVGLVIDAFEEGQTVNWEFDNFELRAP
jgi:nucleoid-associated protein YgaU